MSGSDSGVVGSVRAGSGWTDGGGATGSGAEAGLAESVATDSETNWKNWAKAAASMLSMERTDRKSKRLNSSHNQLSYAVFCSENHTP